MRLVFSIPMIYLVIGCDDIPSVVLSDKFSTLNLDVEGTSAMLKLILNQASTKTLILIKRQAARDPILRESFQPLHKTRGGI